jgi:hypothetical protein
MGKPKASRLRGRVAERPLVLGCGHTVHLQPYFSWSRGPWKCQPCMAAERGVTTEEILRHAARQP